MSAVVLTKEAAGLANIPLVLNGRYTQAVHETVVALRANRRSGTACVKTTSTVNGSGAKPWKQKGTGRARAGSKQSPIWVGGGVVFGPHPRDYSKKVSKKTKRLALLKAFSSKVLSCEVLLVQEFSVSSGKTKDFVSLVKGIAGDEKTLVLSSGFDSMTKLAARNVRKVQLLSSGEVNTEHLLLYKKIIITNDALVSLSERVNK
jgi:large subunit ribosomal protein L4